MHRASLSPWWQLQQDPTANAVMRNMHPFIKCHGYMMSTRYWKHHVSFHGVHIDIDDVELVQKPGDEQDSLANGGPQRLAPTVGIDQNHSPCLDDQETW